MSYQLYRNTTLGHTLQESLDEFLQCGQISPQIALKVLLQFDKCINVGLANRVKTRLTFKVSFDGCFDFVFVTDLRCSNRVSSAPPSQAGHLKTYRFCDNVWTFVLKDVEFREVQDLIKVDKVKIVACDGKSSSNRDENN
jgi:transcription initiation factor TFIIA small subunit